MLKNGIDLTQPPASVLTGLQDLVSTFGHAWLSVVVPGASDPPYLVKMQLIICVLSQAVRGNISQLSSA